MRADLREEATESIAVHSSYREANAEEAEREIIRLKSARYMDERLGKEAQGHVSGITPRGLFVELDRVPVDGFVPSQTLPHRAQFVEERLAWTDPRSGWELRPGDPVRVQVVAVDLRLRRIEFRLVSVPRGGLRPGHPRSDDEGRGRRGRGERDRPPRGGRRRSEREERGLSGGARGSRRRSSADAGTRTGGRKRNSESPRHPSRKSGQPARPGKRSTPARGGQPKSRGKR